MKVLIVYSHFAPAFKAGGPIQSLINLSKFLSRENEVYVLCGCRDLGDHEPLAGIVTNKWVLFSSGIHVFYAEGNLVRQTNLAYKQSQPDVVYINGVFSPIFNWYMLWVARHTTCVIAPRGMLQDGALAVRTLRKRLSLKILSGCGLFRHVRWHATDGQEMEDIIREIGRRVEVQVIPNLALSPSEIPRPPKKKAGLRLVYLSLITQKKNLHLILEAMLNLPVSVTLDVYGPIVDEKYWNDSAPLRQRLGNRLAYHGAVQPREVLQTLSVYDVFVLPSSGENFGHAIYEALSVGLPVITSRFTPWDVQGASAGRICELSSGSVALHISFFLNLSQAEFELMSYRALGVAKDYFGSLEPQKYLKLFR